MDFEIQEQAMTKWCWAAVAASISSYVHEPSASTQLEIVLADLGLQDENFVEQEALNVSGNLRDALSFVQCYRKEQIGPPLFGEGYREWEDSLPLVARIGWPDTEGHGIVIFGCWVNELGEEFYEVADPTLGYDLIRRSEVENEYCKTGSWTHTYFITDYKANWSE
ncbi:papain-like cysteine protease family protein [Rhizobium redzepovicii]|uniref:Papain-like cysteine protease family protein n=1 Tax=Rhizobium redzepovicii TaxID=2867518 RepID=A0AAW8PFI2_9HYPH|nr:papain-like cysteine protease family protein [Rhizobium redzepovicii]MDR9764143.1 papain-like cysteine protease family protein [Rhizobium redzepovicii]